MEITVYTDNELVVELNVHNNEEPKIKVFL